MRITPPGLRGLPHALPISRLPPGIFGTVKALARPGLAPDGASSATVTPWPHRHPGDAHASIQPASRLTMAVSPAANRTSVQPKAVESSAQDLPQLLSRLRAGLRFDAALRSTPLTPERALSLIDGEQDYALRRLPQEMQSARMDDLLRELVTLPWGAETLHSAIEALLRTGQPRARILASAARWVHTPQQLTALLGADTATLASLDGAARRQVIAALAGRLALQQQEARAPMASTLWSLIARHEPAAATGELLRSAIRERPGDGRIAAESLAVLTRFHDLVRDPEPLPRPVDLQSRSHAPGIGRMLAHFAYWLHCQRRPTLMALVAMPAAERWHLLEDYAADPLAAATGPDAQALDPLYLEPRLEHFCMTLREQ